MERLKTILIVVPVDKNHEGCFAVPGSPIGQLLVRRRVGQYGVDVMLLDLMVVAARRELGEVSDSTPVQQLR